MYFSIHRILEFKTTINSNPSRRAHAPHTRIKNVTILLRRMKFVGSTPIRPIGWWRDIKVDLIDPFSVSPEYTISVVVKRRGRNMTGQRTFVPPRVVSLSLSLDFLEGTDVPSTPPLPSTEHPFRGGVGDEAGWWWRLLFTSPLSIPITLKLSINLTVKRFTRRGKRHRAPAISWSQMSRKRGEREGKGRRKFSAYKPCFIVTRSHTFLPTFRLPSLQHVLHFEQVQFRSTHHPQLFRSDDIR